MKKNEKKISFVDLFSGIGGFRLALESVGAMCVFSSEVDENAQRTYYENFGDTPSGDITKIDAIDIPDHDILCAGFPCQPFSIAGKRKGFEDTRGTLFFDIARIVKEKKPKIVFLENVSGIVSHDKGNTIDTIEMTLNNLGYNLYAKTMNAKEYGIPQNRNRWYAVAIRIDVYKKEFVFPKKRELNIKIDDLIYKDIDDENLKISDKANKNIDIHINNFKENKRYNKEEILIVNEVRKSRCGFRCDGISPCLTAKMGTGGNNVPILEKQRRKLSVRECLNLMGFPNNFKLEEYKMESYKQVGNSIVVPLVKEISEVIIEYITQ